MNKEQTHSKINKLINLYNKRISTCSEQYILLENEVKTDENISTLNNLYDEQNLLEEFVEDLQSLLKENDE